MADELTVFPPKKTPTRVKHFLLEKYLDAWGGIIINSNPSEVRLCFVDTCCGSGLYQADPDDGDAPPFEAGSAILGPTCLRRLVAHGESKGRTITAKALLINNRQCELETALRALPADVRDRVPIAVQARRFDEAKCDVLGFCRDHFSFVFIDPYGPTPTPYVAVRDVVRGKYTDTLINFPFFSLQKWSGFLTKSTPSALETARLAAADAFMGGSAWRALPGRAKATGTPLDDLLVDLYVRTLSAEGVFAIALPLHFEDRDRVLYHLVFTSHSVAGFAAAKAKFIEAQNEQFRLREDARFRRTGQAVFGFAAEPPIYEVDPDKVAALLLEEFSGKAASFEDVIRRGLREPRILEADVRRALSVLKKSRKVRYDGRKYHDRVHFGTK